MRIHELIEAVIDYIVVEGVLGADPLVVREHLHTLDSKVDEAYFAHLWPHIAAHKLVQVVVAADALSAPDPSAPQTQTADGTELFTFLGEDDGGDPPLRTGDLRALLERYPGRVRVRCVDDEVYFRLTGSRQRIPRITPMIFTYLQLAARSREKGISALELGPLTQTNQKSVFHYIRVLVQLGLCAKIPASLHGANTSVLVYRKFLDQNPNYRAHMRMTSQEPEAKEEKDVDELEAEPVEDGEVENLGFNFTPFSEMELVAGHIPRERLIRVLDHPGLKNHLLGNHHLLQVLGWPTTGYKNRHRRQLQRHIAVMVDEGIVEYVDIGSALRACLRLTKYNPDFVPPTAQDGEVQEVDEVPVHSGDYVEPFRFQGGATSTENLESQVMASIRASGTQGRTMHDLYISLSGVFRRTLEHIINRIDLVFLPPNLRHRTIRCVIESVQRERRLRLFAIDSYVKHMDYLGIVVTPPPTPPEAGHWADISYRNFVKDAEELFTILAKQASGIVPVGQWNQTTGRKRRSEKFDGSPAPRSAKKRGGKARAIAPNEEGGDGEAESPAPKAKGKGKQKEKKEDDGKFKYSNDIQERGRPRKYVYVVNEDGTRNRAILGDLKTAPGLPPLLIYVKEAGVLVLPPKGFTGVGKPPPITEEAIAEGKPPSHYGVMKRASKAKSTSTRKRKAPADPVEEGAPIEEGAEAGPSKRPRRAAARRKPIVDLPDLEPEEGAEAAGDDDVDFEPDFEPGDEAGPAPTAEASLDGAHPPAAPVEAVDDLLMDVEPAPPAEPTPAEPVPEQLPMETATDTIPVDQQPAETTLVDATLVETISVEQAAVESVPAEPVATDSAPADSITVDATVVESTTAVIEESAPAPVPAPTTPQPKKQARGKKGLVSAAELSVAAESSKTPKRTTRARASAASAEVAPEVSAEPMDVDVPATDAPEAAVGAPDAATVATGDVNSQDATAQAAAGDGTAEEPKDDAAVEEGQAVEEPAEETKQPQGRLTRVDVATLRRIQEILQCLSDCGGVLSDNKLYHEHKEWVTKWAGTDHPFAPAVRAGMDRKVFKRVLSLLVADGRIKERISNMPTTTGRWVKQTIVFGVDTPEVAVSTYIHSLANTVSSAPSTPQPLARSRVALQYSMYKKPGRPSLLSMPDAEDKPEPSSTSGMSSREVYLNEPGMGALLYGYVTGRNLRTKMLHKAILGVICNEPDVPSLVSLSPRVFAMPLVFEELLIRDWLKIVRIDKWDEELYEWTQVPGNLDIKLKDLPQEVAEKANMSGRSWHNAKVNSVRTLFSMLSFLQLLTPLQPCDEASAAITMPEVRGDHPRFYERAPDPTAAPYFIVHDVAPVYHVADPSLSLLGFMPSKDPEEAEQLWSVIQDAAQKPSVPHLQRIEVPSFPFAPDVTGVLDMTVNHTVALTSKRRWKHEVKLVAGQREALNATLDHRGNRKVTDKEEVAKLAYNLALTYEDAEAYLAGRVRQTTTGHRVSVTGGERPASRYRRNDRTREKMAIREELANRIRAARQVHEQRVQAAAARAGVEVTQELLDYIVRNRPMSRLGEIISDTELNTIIESFVRVKSGFQLPVRRPKNRVNTTARPTKGRRSHPVKPKDYVPPVQDNKDKGRRYRHNWTKDEEDLLLDCEAVIRARGRGTMQRGRSVMRDVFPQIGDQVLRSKVKKLLEPPGKAAYYQRLEDAVYNVLQEYQGTDDLPDPNPGSIVNFPLQRYVDFVRLKINKNLLRLPVASAPPPGKAKAPELPFNPKDLVNEYEWEYLKATNTGYDQVLDVPGSEESKLHNISLASVVEEEPMSVHVPELPIDRRTSIIRAAIKMVVSTPTQAYNMNAGSQMLSNYPKEEYEPQIAALVNEGMLNKNINTLKTPGRMYGYANGWNFIAEGTLPSELPDEVRGAQAKLAEGEMVWPLIGQAGDIAVLMELASKHEVDFDFKADDIPALSMERLAYNTRSLTDASFEWDIRVSRSGSSKAAGLFPVAPFPREFPALVPWDVAPGKPAHVQRVTDAVRKAGVEGITPGGLQVETKLTLSEVDSALAALALEATPRVFWAGYDNAHLVARSHWSEWSTLVHPRQPGTYEPVDGPPVDAAPRRWVDIWGDVIPEEWDRAVKAVLGQLFSRPGMTEHNLRLRLAPVLDRMEVNDVLQSLVNSGWLKRRTAQPSDRPVPPVHATDVWEARGIVLVTQDKMWV